MIHVIRHGETDFNLQGRYQGRLDVRLNVTGRRQAEAAAAKVAALAPELIVCSPLKRVTETARVFVDRLRIELTIDARFIERSLGAYEGLTKEEAAARYPAIYARNITRLFDEAPPDGETPREVCARVYEALDELMSSRENRSILIVTHGFVAKAIAAYFNPERAVEDFFEHSLCGGEIVSYHPVNRAERSGLDRKDKA